MSIKPVRSAAPLDVLRREGRATALVELEESAERFDFRCGSGTSVWRRWGAGPAVVLIHGGSGAWNHWLRTIPALVAAGRTVLAPDLPGLGESALPEPMTTTADYCAPLADGLERLLPAGERCDLAAFSMGAEFALPLLRAVPARVRRVVAVGVNLYGRIGFDTFPMRDRRSDDPAERAAAVYENFRTIMLHDPAAIDELALAIQNDNLARRRFGVKMLADFVRIHETVDPLPGGVEFHAINGANDVVLLGKPDAQAEAVTRIWEHGSFHAIPGGSHWVMYDRAEAFNRCLVDLLDG